MIYYLLLAVSIILTVVKSSLYNNYAKTETPDRAGIFTFNAICYGGALAMSLFFGLRGLPSVYTLVCALFYAAVVCSMQGLTVYAMKIGPMSLTALISLYGMIIPTISGPLFWKGEYFTPLKVCGIAVMLISMWMLSNVKKEETANRKWLLVVIPVFFLSGFAGLVEKIHQSTPGRDERAVFLFVAYFIMLIISTVGRFTIHGEKKKLSIKNVVITGVVCGIITGFYAFTNLTLAGKLDSVVYYPVANGGALILTILVSIVIFKEKCTKKQLAGIILGLSSVLMLSF